MKGDHDKDWRWVRAQQGLAGLLPRTVSHVDDCWSTIEKQVNWASTHSLIATKKNMLPLGRST